MSNKSGGASQEQYPKGLSPSQDFEHPIERAHIVIPSRRC